MPTSTRQPTRTDLVDALTNRVQVWRQEAVRLSTAARAFREYADDVLGVQTKGSVADSVANVIAEWCREQSVEAGRQASNLNAQADSMEADGV